MDKKFFHWKMVLIPVFIAGIMLVFFFRDVVFVRIAPKAVLTAAVTDLCAQLEVRFRDDPLFTILQTIDPEGKYTAEVDLETENEYLGPIVYNMIIQTNVSAHQLQADGIASASDKQLALSLYMDDAFMAVSSEDLVNGNYYGITYDSFSKDIRSIPLLNFFVSDAVLTQWDTSVQNIRLQMNQNYPLPRIPEFSKDDLQKLVLGLLTLPCDIESCSISIDETSLACQAVTYSLSGEQVNEFFTDTPYAENASLKVTFYLHKNTLVKIQFSCATDSNSVLYGLTLGQNPVDDVLRLQKICQSEGIYDEFSMFVETRRSKEQLIQSWTIFSSKDEITENTTVKYNWFPSSGILRLQYSDVTEPIELNLFKTDNGIKIKAEDFSKLIPLVTQRIQPKRMEQVSGTITVARDSQIETPTYKNLDQWSIEDLLTLLTGVGAMFGIHIGI